MLALRPMPDCECEPGGSTAHTRADDQAARQPTAVGAGRVRRGSLLAARRIGRGLECQVELERRQLESRREYVDLVHVVD